MPDDTGLGINQPISVEAALAWTNGSLKYKSWWARFERENSYQPSLF